ncbi:MAG: hypothetical protein JWM80_5833, partial [Cyanobacteria bacterium RYN_339]|nr:hypothetical protein [Cyanobacteria bacterium RYN_339]
RMPGLNVALDHHARPDLRLRFQALHAAAQLKRGYRAESWVEPEGRVALGRVDLGIFNQAPQPLVSRDGRYRLVFQGEVFDRPERVAALAARGVPLTGDDNPDVLLAAYLADGEEGIERLNGSFFFALWDAEGATLLVGGDRHATRPHFYGFHQGRFYLSPMVAGVLEGRGDRPAMCVEGMAEFLALEHPLADRTTFTDIKAFPGGAFLTITPVGARWRTYWEPAYHGPNEPGPRPIHMWLDEATHLYGQAVRRALVGDVSVPLSGGTDSRTILAFTDRRDFPVVTFGAEASDDVQIARQVAAHLGLGHEFMPLEADYLVRNARDVVAYGEGMVSLYHAHSLSGLDRLRAIAPVSVKGMTAEFVRLESVDNILAEQPRTKLEKLSVYARHARDGRRPLAATPTDAALAAQIASVTWSNLTPALAREALAPDLAEAMIAAVERNMLVEIARTPGWSPEDRVAAYGLRNRQRRFTQMGLKLAGTAHECRKPFDDYDLVDFCLGMPSATRRKLLDRLLCQTAPELAAFRRTGSGTAISAGFPARAAAFGRKELKKLLRPGRVQSFADPQALLRTAARTFYEDVLLDPATLHNGFFNPTGLQAMVARHMTGHADLAGPLCALATFELWRRRYLVGTERQAQAG